MYSQTIYERAIDSKTRTTMSTSIAHAWTSVILAGKCGSQRHSATSFSENVALADASFRVIGFIICSAGSNLTSSCVSIIWEYVKKRNLNLVLVVALVLESKGLYDNGWLHWPYLLIYVSRDNEQLPFSSRQVRLHHVQARRRVLSVLPRRSCHSLI